MAVRRMSPGSGPLGWLLTTRAATALANVYLWTRRHPGLALLGFFVYLAGIGLLTPMSAMAADDGPAPTGFGDMLKAPELHEGEGGETLFEYYSMTAYYFDTNRLGINDAHHIIINGLASAFMLLTVAIVRGAIVLTWWLFDFDSTNQLAEQITGSMGAVATSLMAWLLPSALAIGAIVAYMQSRGAPGGGLSQILWVGAGGVLAISFALSPNMWVDAITGARTLGSNELMNATSSAIAESEQPFEYDGAHYDRGDPTNTMLRKSADAIWRTYVVTPWCIGEFGSSEACARYGKGILDVGTDPDARSDWIQENAEGHPGEYDSDGAMYKWTAGKNSFDRLGISLIAMVVAVVFSVLIITVSATATMAFIGAVLLLFAGVVFTMLWCIPGKPRAWGNNWLENLVGLVIQSILGTLLVGATLVLTAGAFQIAGANGWGLGAGLSILVAFAAFAMRRTLATIMQAITPGKGMTALMGVMAIRSASKMFGRVGRTFSRGATARGGRKAVGGARPGAGTKGATSGRAGAPEAPAPGPHAVPVAGSAGGAAASSTNARRYRSVRPVQGGAARKTPRVAGQRPNGAGSRPGGRPATGAGRRTGTGTGAGAARLRDNPPARRQPAPPRTPRPRPATAQRSASRDGMLKPRRDPLTRHPRMAPKTPATPTTTRNGGRK
jgi:hypothetical protein